MIKLMIMINGCTGQEHDFDKPTTIFFNNFKIRLNACLLRMQVGTKYR
jgi:hypothetical protein